MKKETLSEKLKTVKDDEYVYLGCKNGSSWFFIGTCAELKKSLAQRCTEYYALQRV